MWLLWFAGYNNSVDFIGLYKTEAQAEMASAAQLTQWFRKNGRLKISYVEKDE